MQNQDEWTGEQKLQYTDVPEDIEPEEIRPMGNYAVSITWPDGFSQVKYVLLDLVTRITKRKWSYPSKKTIPDAIFNLIVVIIKDYQSYLN